MELPVIILGETNTLSFEELTEANLDVAKGLCDRCVGENLYTKDQLASIIKQPTHYFYLLVTPERNAVGYIYFFLTDLDTMVSLSKVPREHLTALVQEKNPIIGNLQSIGIVEEYQHRQLSTELIRFSLEYLQTDSAVDIAFGVSWKIDGYVPMEKTLRSLDFLYLMDTHRVWYDNQNLICPYCKGRCECDAAVYYKFIGRRP
jgi:hypothetical protein